MTRIIAIAATLAALTAAPLLAQTAPCPTLPAAVTADAADDTANADEGSNARVAQSSSAQSSSAQFSSADACGKGAANTVATPQDKKGTRMFGVMPNYATVESSESYASVSAGGKFRMAAMNTFDPYVYPFVGAVATMNRTYGSGQSAYLKNYATSLADNSIGNFLTSAVLPTVLHQDPRYFERGTGSFLSRLGYAASRSVVTRGDSGRPQFNVSELAGNAMAAGVSNLYYPSAERSLTGTLTRWGMQVMWDTLSNELKEFWPDVRGKLHRH